MTKTFNAIGDFLFSDLYLYISLGVFLFCLALTGICKLIEYILERKRYNKRRSIKVSDEMLAALQSRNPDERESALRALLYGEAIERKNDIEVNNYPTKEILKIHQEKFAGHYFISEQRPSSSEDKP